MNYRKLDYDIDSGMTGKILAFCFTIAMLVTAIPTLAVDVDVEKDEYISENIIFSVPTLHITDDGFVEIIVDGTISQSSTPGAPSLPKMTVIKKLPFGVTGIEVEFSHTGIQTMPFEGTLAPAPSPRLLSDLNAPIKDLTPEPLDVDIYASDTPYGEFFTSAINVGLDTETDELTTYAIVTIYPCIIRSMKEKTLQYITECTIDISYNRAPSLALDDEEDDIDLLIISADAYVNDLAPLIEHKEAMDITTKLVSIGQIKSNSLGEDFIVPDWVRDDQEMIKYFIHNATREWKVKYVLAVGGWRTLLGLNIPRMQFPIRYSHNVDGEPGYHAEQYYSCFLRYDDDYGRYVFDTWDSNENDRFAEWDYQGYDTYDPIPDVYWGRLACRNKPEVRTIVDKIITYETTAYGQPWFNKFLSVTGDGFQDQDNLGLPWNVSEVPDGDYTIYGQSELQSDPTEKGPIDKVTVRLDRTKPSSIDFSDDSHTQIEPLTEEQENPYPAKPVAEIVVPSDGDIIGNTDVKYMPDPNIEAYCTDFSGWGDVDYNVTTDIIYIKSKSYDPRPQMGTVYDSDAGQSPGSETYITIWINNSHGDTVFGPISLPSIMFYEGELEGEIAIQFVEDDFEPTRIWASNGNWTDMNDVIDAYSKGYGLAYINGHSSCLSYGDHFPGIPGGRHNAQVNGIAAINTRFGLTRYAREEGEPLFPLDHLSNGNELPVLLYSGCHSGQFDTSFVSLFYDPYNVLFGSRYATWTPEGVAWWITRLPQGGSIATIGNGGLGSGYLGDRVTWGLTGWMFPRFFKHYADGMDVLSEIYTEVLIEFVTGVPRYSGDPMASQSTRKHFEQWALLGDPTLKIGGYPPETGTLDEEIAPGIKALSEDVEYLFTSDTASVGSLGSPYQVTTNPAPDTNPESMVSTEDGEFIVGYAYETKGTEEIHGGFSFSNGGVVWDNAIFPTSFDSGATSLYSWTEGEGDDAVTYTIGGASLGANAWGAIIMNDITNPNSWGTYTPYGWISDLNPGQYGVAVTAHINEDDEMEFAGIWTSEGHGVYGNWLGDDASPVIASGDPSDFSHFVGVCDQTDKFHYFAFEGQGRVRVTVANPEDHTFDTTSFSGKSSPDVAAADGWGYLVFEDDGVIELVRTSDHGESWSSAYTVISGGATRPRLVINDDGSLRCYFIKEGEIRYRTSTNHGASWGGGTLTGIIIDSPYVVTKEGLVYDGGDGDLYADIFIDTKGAVIRDIELIGTRTLTTKVVNSGTEYIIDGQAEIIFEGDSPLGQFFGGSPLLMALFKGRIFTGGYTMTDLGLIAPGDGVEITSGSVFGLGHVYITVRVSEDGDVLAVASEDGFLLGGRILLLYPEE